MKRITLRATPPAAVVFLDGEAVTTHPDGAIERPTGEIHRLRIEAPGYTAEERTLTFESDRTVAVRLVRARAGTPVGIKLAAPSHSTGTKITDPSEVLGY